MANEKSRTEKIIPIIRERAKAKVDDFKDTFPWEKILSPLVSQIEKEERKKAKEEMKTLFQTLWPTVFRPVFEMSEISTLAKFGASNMLRAMGYSPKTDAPLKGFSGNRYTLSVVAPTSERLLIVDQMMLSTELMIPWFKVQMPKTFDQYKVTIADFFKFLDVSMGLSKPSIYWLHDYEVSPHLAENLGFSMKKMMKDIFYAFGDLEGIPREEIEKEMIGDEEFREMMKMLDTSMAEMFTGMGDAIVKMTNPSPSTFPFNLKRTANRFRIPIMSMKVLDVLEASTLDPKIPSDRRTLKGYSFELGLLDFLNPPWPDYVLELARYQKSVPFSKVGKILEAAETVGHKARSIRELFVDPRKLKRDPADGVETLEQNDLVTVGARETYKITPQGREYIKEVRKRPRKHALSKAIDFLSGRASIYIPPFILKGKKKDKEEE